MVLTNLMYFCIITQMQQNFTALRQLRPERNWLTCVLRIIYQKLWTAQLYWLLLGF